MKPTIHYDPQNTSAYSVDKSVVRMVLAFTVNRQCSIRHLNIISAFTAEPHANRDICVRQIPRWNGSYTDPGSLIGRLHLNLYGSKSAANTYYSGLQRHLYANHFTASESEPCLYTQKTSLGCIIAAITTDDFLAAALLQSDISDFRDMLFLKYTVKDMDIHPLFLLGLYSGLLAVVFISPSQVLLLKLLPFVHLIVSMALQVHSHLAQIQ